jgi:subtilase family serine protease
LACLVVLAATLLGCVLPQVASAAPRFALSSTNRPRAVCPKATSLEIECDSIDVPTVAATSADAVGPALEGSGEGGGFSPADLRSAYKLPETGGSGQTVAIVDAYNDPNANSDLKMYRKTYKLSECTEENGCFKKVNQAGETKNYPASNKGWSEEISLDLDMVSAVCPGCHIVLVEAKNNEGINLYEAEDEAATLGATEISNSWGATEYEGEESNDKYFDHPGIPVTFSAGDDGYGVQYPAASQYVISVGGTALKKESKSARGWTEEVWRYTKLKVGEEGSGTGSGCSKYETAIVNTNAKGKKKHAKGK